MRRSASSSGILKPGGSLREYPEKSIVDFAPILESGNVYLLAWTRYCSFRQLSPVEWGGSLRPAREMPQCPSVIVPIVSPDGLFFVERRENPVLREVASGKPVTPVSEDLQVFPVGFSSDGKTLIAENGLKQPPSVTFWSVPTLLARERLVATDDASLLAALLGDDAARAGSRGGACRQGRRYRATGRRDHPRTAVARTTSRPASPTRRGRCRCEESGKRGIGHLRRVDRTGVDPCCPKRRVCGGSPPRGGIAYRNAAKHGKAHGARSPGCPGSRHNPLAARDCRAPRGHRTIGKRSRSGGGPLLARRLAGSPAKEEARQTSSKRPEQSDFCFPLQRNCYDVQAKATGSSISKAATGFGAT